jgi:hypothetical protein
LVLGRTAEQSRPDSRQGKIFFLFIISSQMGGACGTYGRQERCIQGFGEGDLRERDHLEDPGVDERMILEWIFKKGDGETWTGLVWLRIGTGDGLL